MSEQKSDPGDCRCHGRPHLQCPSYNPELFGHYPFDQRVEVAPRACLPGRAVVQIRWSLSQLDGRGRGNPA